jgi:hypothetical protein
MATQKYKYYVEATAWTSSGSGSLWKGEVTISQRADSSIGLGELQHNVAVKANDWLRRQDKTPQNSVELRVWYPIPGSTAKRPRS